MKNKSKLDKDQEEEQYTLEDFDLTKPEVVRESLKVSPKYEGKLRLAKTSISLPQAIIDDLRQLARIKGMTSYRMKKAWHIAKGIIKTRLSH